MNRRDVNMKDHLEFEIDDGRMRIGLVNKIQEAIVSFMNERDPHRDTPPEIETQLILEALAFHAGWSHGDAAFMGVSRDARDRVLRDRLMLGKQMALAAHECEECSASEELLREIQVD